MSAESMYEAMMAMDGETCEFEVTRTVVEPGRSFSEPAMSELIENLTLWIGTRVMRRWESANEPPTVCKVTIQVDVQ